MNHLYEPHSEREFTDILSPQDVGFLAAVKQNYKSTAKNLAAIDSGFFNASDLDFLKTERQKIKAAEQCHFIKTKAVAELGRAFQEGKCSLLLSDYFEKTKRGAQGEALKRLGSSKGAKVRHDTGRKHLDRFITRSRRMPPRHKTLSTFGVNADLDATNHIENTEGCWRESKTKKIAYAPAKKSRAYLMSREWSKQIKMQMIYSPSPSDAPPSNSGDRYTEKLTARAVTKIFESGAYVAACHGGFTTFLTLTFTSEQRDRIFSGDVTLGGEVSRFLDGIKKLYRRGFTAQVRSDKDDNRQQNITACETSRQVEGQDGDFHYIWVAECPANEDGEPNPHVHMLLRWSVEKEVFQSWAARIEKIWGNGFANLQRIKQPKAAGSYLIKAVGYAAKGDNAEQGLIRGNRYNIARCSRAPAWEVLASFDADNMAGIIKECGYRLERWRKPFEKEIARKRRKRDEAIKALSIHKTEKSKAFRLQRLIEKLDSEIRDERTTLQNRGAFARSDNTFSICFEGEQAKEKTDNFLFWACGARGWSMACSDVDLADIKLSAVEHYQDEYQRFLNKRADWQSQLAQTPPMDNEVYEQLYIAAMEELHEYLVVT